MEFSHGSSYRRGILNTIPNECLQKPIAGEHSIIPYRTVTQYGLGRLNAEIPAVDISVNVDEFNRDIFPLLEGYYTNLDDYVLGVSAPTPQQMSGEPETNWFWLFGLAAAFYLLNRKRGNHVSRFRYW